MTTSMLKSPTAANGGVSATYQKDGYILAPGVLSFRDIEPLRLIIDRQVDRFALKLRDEGKVKNLFEFDSFDNRLAFLLEGQGTQMRSWDEIIFSPQLHRLITHPKLLDALEPLLGPDITFQGDYHLRPKMPDSHLTAFPWHQDSQYYGEPTKNMHIVTVTVPLVDLTEENGCLWMIPGSHKWGYFPAERSADQNMRMAEDAESMAIKRGTESIPVPMEIGDILAFGNMTLHASKLNQSRGVRWTLDLRYSPTRR